MEITMYPLPKAVYFLFLRHKEGILFKNLTDYTKELTEIYCSIKGGLTYKDIKSIEDITDHYIQSMYLDEINPMLEDYLKDNCEFIFEDNTEQCEQLGIENGEELFDKFMDYLNGVYLSNKVQRHCEKYGI